MYVLNLHTQSVLPFGKGSLLCRPQALELSRTIPFSCALCRALSRNLSVSACSLFSRARVSCILQPMSTLRLVSPLQITLSPLPMRESRQENTCRKVTFLVSSETSRKREKVLSARTRRLENKRSKKNENKVNKHYFLRNCEL